MSPKCPPAPTPFYVPHVLYRTVNVFLVCQCCTSLIHFFLSGLRQLDITDRYMNVLHKTVEVCKNRQLQYSLLVCPFSINLICWFVDAVSGRCVGLSVPYRFDMTELYTYILDV